MNVMLEKEGLQRALTSERVGCPSMPSGLHARCSLPLPLCHWCCIPMPRLLPCGHETLCISAPYLCT